MAKEMGSLRKRFQNESCHALALACAIIKAPDSQAIVCPAKFKIERKRDPLIISLVCHVSMCPPANFQHRGFMDRKSTCHCLKHTHLRVKHLPAYVEIPAGLQAFSQHSFCSITEHRNGKLDCLQRTCTCDSYGLHGFCAGRAYTCRCLRSSGNKFLSKCIGRQGQDNI